MPKAKHRRLRWALASCIAIAATVAIAMGFFQLQSITVDALGDLTVNEMVAELIAIKREKSDKLFNVALIAGGALFALIFAKKDEARIVLSDVPELIMFFAAVGLLLASLLCDFQYQNVLSEALLLGGQADKDSMPFMTSVF